MTHQPRAGVARRLPGAVEMTTLLQLCKAIVKTAALLPDVERDEIARVYAKTWTLAVLVSERLANATKAARPRLVDLFLVLDAAHERQLRAARAAARGRKTN